MRGSAMNHLSATDARACFSELLERVAVGEQFTITRRGAPVVRLVPVTPVVSEQERRAAIIAMRQLADRNRLDGLSVKSLIAESRK